MDWWRSAAAVWHSEWALLWRHPKLAIAFAGVLFVPALYAFIYLYAMWDPAGHTRALPAGLVNLDAGATYRDRELNLGADVLAAIERHGQFAYRRFDDPAAARAAVRRGHLAFVLEIPADFSRSALPGVQPGAAKLRIYTSEGNNYSGASFARRFAPEVAQRVNTMLSEARWDLVLTTAAGSQRNLESLRSALGDLRKGATELGAQLARARDGSAQLAGGSHAAVEAAQQLRSGAGQLSEGAQQMAAGVRQSGQALRAIDARRPSEADLVALRQGARAQLDGERELARGLDSLAAGGRHLGSGLGQLRSMADEVPLFGTRLIEGVAPLEDGMRQLATGLERAREGQVQLLQGAGRLDEGVTAMVDAAQRAATTLGALGARLPDESRLDSFADGARELSRGSDAVLVGLRQLALGSGALQGGLVRLTDGAARLDTGIELLQRSLPLAVDTPGGSAQGLALSVEPVVEVVAPVPNNGSALTPNFVPLALWVGAVMAAFLVHLRHLPETLTTLPRTAIAAGKLALPALAVLLQAALMLLMLVVTLHVPVAQPAAFALTLAGASLTFLALVWTLVRWLGDLGKVVALLLLVVQVSAAGALLPIELSDEAFQAIHPYLPLTWVVQAFRTSMYGAYDGDFWPAFGVVAAIGLSALALGCVPRRWLAVPAERWHPPLDLS